MIEDKIKVHTNICSYLNIEYFDDYIEHITEINSGIPSSFLTRLEKTIKVEYITNGIKIHTYYIFNESPDFVFKLFVNMNKHQLVKWNCPPNGFENFYSIISGNIEIYTFGIYNEYIFPNQKVCFLSFNEVGFKIDDFISTSY